LTIDENGDAVDHIKIKAEAVGRELSFFRFHVSSGWEQPLRQRKKVCVYSSSPVDGALGGVEHEVTTSWLTASRIEILVHFHSDVPADHEFVVVLAISWPGKCKPLIKDGRMEAFKINFSGSIDLVDYVVVLPSELVELIPDQDARGSVVGFYGLVQDVTDLRDAHAKAEASEQRLRSITDNIPSMIAYIDRDRHYRFNSRFYESWTGRPVSEITGRHVRDVLGADAYAAVQPNLDRAFAGERVDFDVEVRDPHGDSRFVRGTYIPDLDADGNVIGVYSSSTDVTTLKKIERQLERLAQHDTLTGLPNRHTFNDAIAMALSRSQQSGMQVALLFLDIDGFKQINDTLGHAGGDDVLREFARRLTRAVRSTDVVAARMRAADQPEGVPDPGQRPDGHRHHDVEPAVGDRRARGEHGGPAGDRGRVGQAGHEYPPAPAGHRATVHLDA